MTGYLNRFACQAESKLAEVGRRTQQIQTTLLLLEAKLASIPDLAGVTLEQQSPVAQTTVEQTPTTAVEQTAPELHTETDSGVVEPIVEPAEPGK